MACVTMGAPSFGCSGLPMVKEFHDDASECNVVNMREGLRFVMGDVCAGLRC